MKPILLKWAVIFAAYITLTTILYFIDPQFVWAVRLSNAVIVIGFAFVSVALALWSGWDSRRFYKLGVDHFEDASMAWVNACHGMFRQEPAGEAQVYVVCRCNQRIGVLPRDPSMEAVTELTEAHTKEKLLEVRAVVKAQRKALEELEVKQDSAV